MPADAPHQVLEEDADLGARRRLAGAQENRLRQRRRHRLRPEPVAEGEHLRHPAGDVADFPEDRVHRIRFEKLCAHPSRQLEALIDFIDPALADDTWLAEACKIPRPATPDFLELPLNLRHALTSACRPGLEILDYDTSP